jgi:hypothetical protein
MKQYGYIITSIGLALAYSSMVFADDSCRSQATELNDKQAAQFIALESECYPPNMEPTTSSDNKFELSPECQAKYEALWAKSSAEWDALYEACPDLPRPRGDGVPSIAGPTNRAPTKQELLDRLSTIKGKLKRVQAKHRKLARRCGR